MAESAKVVLKWSYTPVDFFEEKETAILPGYEHTIENGEIIVSMDLNDYQSSPDIRRQLHDQLVSIFKGAALVSQKPFTLNNAGQETIHSDGHKEISLQISSVIMIQTADKVDLVVSDRNGNVVANTKQERQNRRRKLAQLSVKYRTIDPIVESILLGFERSLNNPETELVHLYEIRDSLSQAFGGDDKAKKDLGITNSKWSRLGQLANGEPLNQGRHRGEHIGTLRDATRSELEEARNIAVEMIVAYLEYLESKLP